VSSTSFVQSLDEFLTLECDMQVDNQVQLAGSGPKGASEY
jgi:hypothetical protein